MVHGRVLRHSYGYRGSTGGPGQKEDSGHGRVHIMLQYIQDLMNSKNDEGASAVEYGLLVAAIAAVIVGAIFVLGGTVNTTFEDTNTAIENQGE